MQLDSSTLSILLNAFHITSQGYSLAGACEISVQRKLLHTSAFLPLSHSLLPPVTLTAGPFCVHLCCPHGLGSLSCCQQGDRLKGQGICLSCAVAGYLQGRGYDLNVNQDIKDWEGQWGVSLTVAVTVQGAMQRTHLRPRLQKQHQPSTEMGHLILEEWLQ